MLDGEGERKRKQSLHRGRTFLYSDASPSFLQSLIRLVSLANNLRAPSTALQQYTAPATAKTWRLSQMLLLTHRHGRGASRQTYKRATACENHTPGSSARSRLPIRLRLGLRLQTMSAWTLLCTVAACAFVAVSADGALPTAQPWERCTCAKDEQPSLATAAREGGPGYMANLEDILETQCDIVDPFRCYVNNRLDEDMEVDYVVVGAGSAGATVAGRLAEDLEKTVVVLEAGGPEPTGTQIPGTYFGYLQTDIDWNYPLEPETTAFLGQPGGIGYWPRGKVMGGTGVLHGMMYQRGNRWDYDHWAEIGNKGWDYESVLPYFKKSEDNTQIGTYAEAEYHGTGGPVTVEQFHDHPALADDVLEGARELGYRAPADLTGHNQTGFTLAQATTRDGARLSLSKAFLQPIAHQRNLFVSMNSLATKVLVDPWTRRAVGVEYERDGQKHTVRARREVILSAGAVATPQLLLLSGIGPRADLAKLGIRSVANIPDVGKNLFNHVSFTLKFVLTNASTAYETLSNSSVRSFLENRLGPLTSTGLSQMTGFANSGIKSDATPEHVPDLQIFFAGYLANASRTGSDTEVPQTGVEQRFEITPTLLRPASSGTLSLRSADPHDYPIITANYLQEQVDADKLVKGIRLAQALANTAPLRKLGAVLSTAPAPGCENIPFDTDKYWNCAIRSLTNPENHQIGTASMGKVVNERLQVNGVHRLRCVDASVIPTVPGGNVNAPIIMVAEKGADMIKEDQARIPSINWGIWDFLRHLR